MSNDILDEFDPPDLIKEWRGSRRKSQRLAASRELKDRHARARAQWLKDNPKVGHWTILGLAPFQSRRAMVACQCACGAKHNVLLASIKSGGSTRCVECARKARQK